jgi:TRAP-type mannitol/chloroaromatic compound transport system permease small subunit
MGTNYSFIKLIDRINARVGEWASWLMLVLIGAITYEVVARYFFRAPTSWSLDATWILYGIYFMFGGAYTLMGRGHVRMDFFTSKLPLRRQQWIDIAGYLFFFFPLMILLIYSSYRFIVNSWAIYEKSAISQWRPPIYPIRTLAGIALLLLLMQGIVEFIKLLREISKGRPS